MASTCSAWGRGWRWFVSWRGRPPRRRSVPLVLRGWLTWVQPAGRGAPLAVAVGGAVLGADGRDGSSLIDGAEEARFAAAATGIGVVGASPGGRLDGL